jgi:hypothetical protein
LTASATHAPPGNDDSHVWLAHGRAPGAPLTPSVTAALPGRRTDRRCRSEESRPLPFSMAVRGFATRTLPRARTLANSRKLRRFLAPLRSGQLIVFPAKWPHLGAERIAPRRSPVRVQLAPLTNPCNHAGFAPLWPQSRCVGGRSLWPGLWPDPPADHRFGASDLAISSGSGCGERLKRRDEMELHSGALLTELDAAGLAAGRHPCLANPRGPGLTARGQMRRGEGVGATVEDGLVNPAGAGRERARTYWAASEARGFPRTGLPSITRRSLSRRRGS